MKLKLKHISCPGVLHRLEVPNECALQEARERCFEALPFRPGRAAGDVVLSLNKKSPLAGDASDTLKGIGVCSGDLLWVIAPDIEDTVYNSSASTAASRAAVASRGSSDQGPWQPSRNGSNAPATTASSRSSAAEAAGAAAIARAQAQQLLYPAEQLTSAARTTATGTAGSPVGSNTSVTFSNSLRSPHFSEASAAAPAGSVAMDVDAPLQQQQQQMLPDAGIAHVHGTTQGTAATAVPDDLAAAAAAAAVDLDHPPAKPWMPDHLLRLLDQQQQQHGHLSSLQLLLLTVHAAMLESGLQYLHQQQQQQHSEAAAAAVQIPELIGAGGVYSLAYTLPAAATDSSSSSQLLIGLKAVDVGNYLVVAGSITAATAAAANASDSVGSSSSAKLVVTINLPKTAASAPSAATESSSSAAAAAAAPTAAGVYRFSDLPKLWVMLKDKLCLPLLVAGCAAAGIAAPVGLSSLPFELQEAVLSLLEAKDLAALCCTCTPMRHRAATDTLWKPLFDKEFPTNTSDHTTSRWPGSPANSAFSYALDHAVKRIRQDANRHGWKWAFGAAWAQRARVNEEQRHLAHRALLPHRAPHPNPMPWGPFRPQHPMMPPNIIGGDYDRFPNLGGFGGLGPTGVPGFSGNAGFGGLGYSGGVLNPGTGLLNPGGVGLGSGGALFSGAQGRGGVLPGSAGNGTLGGRGGAGFPGLGCGRRREGGGGLGRLY